MIHTYKIQRTGELFQYDTSTNGLLTGTGEPLSRPFTPPADWMELQHRFGSHTIARNPTTIKISLGQACNYSCGYCMQKDIGNPNERPASGLANTLAKNLKRLNLSELARVELWGGETLLYWNDIKTIMQEFDSPNITWYIPTNGTPLMHKHIDFFMGLQGNIAMGISHDGPAHATLRGPEFLHKKVDVFRRIEEECGTKIQYSFNAVISSTNFDFFKINQFFQDFFAEHNLKPKALNFELGRVYDESMANNSAHHVISGDQLPLYHESLTRYLDAHIQQYWEMGETMSGPLLATNLFHTGMGVLPFARTLAEQKVMLLKSNCGVDDSRLMTVDMLSNVRTCQNTDDKFTGGNLLDFKGIRIKRAVFDRDAHCGACHVRPLCKSSCPLDIGPATFLANCSIEKIHYSAIQLAAFKVLFRGDVHRIQI